MPSTVGCGGRWAADVSRLVQPDGTSIPSRSRALAANSYVNSRALPKCERFAACPDQSGENSLESAASATALIGASAPAAVGNAGVSDEIGPISRTIRLIRPRAGRPVNTFVSTVPSSRAFPSAMRCRPEIVDSDVNRYAVPICTPAAPSAWAAAMPRPSAIPPAATTGAPIASTTCGTSAMVPGCESTASVRNMPRWPPASNPCAITASQP